VTHILTGNLTADAIEAIRREAIGHQSLSVSTEKVVWFGSTRSVATNTLHFDADDEAAIAAFSRKVSDGDDRKVSLYATEFWGEYADPASTRLVLATWTRDPNGD
jgi:hypothetical protein